MGTHWLRHMVCRYKYDVSLNVPAFMAKVYAGSARRCYSTRKPRTINRFRYTYGKGAITKNQCCLEYIAAVNLAIQSVLDYQKKKTDVAVTHARFSCSHTNVCLLDDVIKAYICAHPGLVVGSIFCVVEFFLPFFWGVVLYLFRHKVHTHTCGLHLVLLCALPSDTPHSFERRFSTSLLQFM